MTDAIRRVGLAVLLGLVAFGCDESRVDISSFPDEVGVETRQLVLALRNNGANAEIAESIPPQSSLFSTPTTHLRVNGGDVFVFEFATVAEADAAVVRLPSVLAVTTFPVGTRFYRGSRIIVLTSVTDPATNALFERLLGAPIA